MPVVVKLRLRQACSGVTIQVMAEDASYGADSVLTGLASFWEEFWVVPSINAQGKFSS